jgi:hypothetical protein
MKRFAFGLFTLAILVVTPSPSRGGFVYQLDGMGPGSFVVHSGFNNSQTTETEDNFVTNSFQVETGGTRLLSFTFLLGINPPPGNNESISAVLYKGASLTDPNAGGGLQRIAMTTTTLAASDAFPFFQTITLDSPVDLAVGDIFYAALYVPQNPGNIFPFALDDFSATPVPFLGRSFFDVGPQQGAPYNLDQTGNLTLMGQPHPVVGFATNVGNLVLRVNADVTPVAPEPSSITLLGIGLVGIAGSAWRRWRNKLLAIA